MEFSLDTLHLLKKKDLQKPAFIDASDGTKLAYYSFIPSHPQAFLIFYHGAGYYSGALYQSFAQQLADQYSIGVYLVDIRGNGYSQGPRGDASSTKQVFDDVTTLVNFVHGQHPGVPLYLGGHSAGAGLVLNYSGYRDNPLVTGYILVAPYLGRTSEALKIPARPEDSFIKQVRVGVFILYGITGGWFGAHTPALYFNYPQELLVSDPLIVTSYTPTLLAAVAPEDPIKLFKNITKPLALFAGEKDEQFDAEKLVNYKRFFSYAIASSSEARIIPQATHFECMLQVAPYCASFITQTLSNTT